MYVNIINIVINREVNMIRGNTAFIADISNTAQDVPVEEAYFNNQLAIELDACDGHGRAEVAFLSDDNNNIIVEVEREKSSDTEMLNVLSTSNVNDEVASISTSSSISNHCASVGSTIGNVGYGIGYTVVDGVKVVATTAYDTGAGFCNWVAGHFKESKESE